MCYDCIKCRWVLGKVLANTTFYHNLHITTALTAITATTSASSVSIFRVVYVRLTPWPGHKTVLHFDLGNRNLEPQIHSSVAQHTSI